MRIRVRTALTAVAVAAAGTAAAQPAGPRAAGPVATYWMSAQTTSGFMAGMGGGARPSAGQMMGMMMGGRGGSQTSQTLLLQLGSQRRAPGEPHAEHLPPAGLGAGQSLPLVTPRQAPRQEAEPGQMPRDFQKPRGRMLVFWGCGERARPGQPLVIDFSKVAAGQIPPGMAALGQGLNLSPAQPPSPSRSATYGEWPNERGRTTVPPRGSLVGEHTVRGDYTPEIHFNLSQDQDFLGPLTLNAGAPSGSSAAPLGWRALPGAQAYLATAMGGGQNDTMVMWTSSEVQASSFALPEYLSPGDITRLLANRALMSPQTTSCAIPREAVEAMGGGGLVQLAAYGREANFAYPPRPADPKARWNPEWQVKVRYRSSTGTMLGMSDMGAMGADDEDAPPGRQPHRPQRGQQQQQEQPGSPAGQILRGLGRFGF
jgi:hypothetical protein